jgi:hypothetical protein
MNATLLVRSKTGPFQIVAQDYQSTFDKNMSIHRSNRVAGKVAETDSDDVVIYVPSTYFVHGVGAAGGKRHLYMTMFCDIKEHGYGVES